MASPARSRPSRRTQDPALHAAAPWIDAEASPRQITDDVMRAIVGRPGAAWFS